MSNEPLQRYLDDRLAQVPRWMSAVAHDTRTALHSPTTTRALRDAGGGPLFEAEAALRQHHPLWARRVAELLPARWQAELAPPAPASGARGRTLSLDSLSLVDESAAEENIELLRIVQRCESEHEGVLRELQSRSATLCGHDGVKRRSNPLRPELLVRAVWEAADALGLAGGARQALLRALAEPLARALGGVFADALARLEALGIEPAAWRATALPGRRLPGNAPSGYDLTRPGALDGLRGRMQARGGVSTPAELDSGPERLDAMLMRILAAPAGPGGPIANRLLERLPLLEAAAPRRAQRQLIELMAQLVEAMLHDPALRLPVRAALARLQLPLLRVALGDPQLLDELQHPAWALCNRLGQHTLGFDDDRDPRLCTLVEGVEVLFAELATAPQADAAAFARAGAALEALIEADLAAERRAAEIALGKLQQAEQRAALELGLKRQVQARIELASGPPGTPVPPCQAEIKRFLVGRWVQVLAESALREGEASTPARLAVVDEILASLQPPRGEPERQALLRGVPALLQRLQQGFALIDLPAAERSALLDALMQAHTELLRPGRATAAPADPDSPEEIVRRLREEPELPPQSAPSPGADSLFDVATLDTVPAALLDAADAGAAPRDWLRQLQPGSWCRLVARGSWTVARLLWVSPSREHWLFSDADEGRTHALTRRALERLVAEQLAAPLEERNVLERAVDAVLVPRGR